MEFRFAVVVKFSHRISNCKIKFYFFVFVVREEKYFLCDIKNMLV